MQLTNPSFKLESNYWKSGFEHVIGLDEVGRGAFAGPIVAAGVIYKPGFKHKFLEKVNDSKLLKPGLREELYEFIKANSTWTIEEVSIDFINEFGIGKANIKVFHKTLRKLLLKTGYTQFRGLVDGYNLKIPNCKGVIKGDRISLSIASASIIAKVYRDKLMREVSSSYPSYNFKQNKGYGTKFHRDAIAEFGLCDFHRTSFNLSKFL